MARARTRASLAARPRPSVFGVEVRAARELAGVSAKHLCRTAELKHGHISHIESGRRGRRPSKTTVERIVGALRAFGVTVSAARLLTGEGDGPQLGARP
jgi:transcriptional regulator with XRE-family HTH domain